MKRSRRSAPGARRWRSDWLCPDIRRHNQDERCTALRFLPHPHPRRWYILHALTFSNYSQWRFSLLRELCYIPKHSIVPENEIHVTPPHTHPHHHPTLQTTTTTNPQPSLPRPPSLLYLLLYLSPLVGKGSRRQLITTCHYFPALTLKELWGVYSPQISRCDAGSVENHMASGGSVSEVRASERPSGCTRVSLIFSPFLPRFYLSQAPDWQVEDDRALALKGVKGSARWRSTPKQSARKIYVGKKQRWSWKNRFSRTTRVGVKTVFITTGKWFFACGLMSLLIVNCRKWCEPRLCSHGYKVQNCMFPR